MLKTLQKIEERVSNAEAKILIFVVVTMLLLAVYNVLYRNVLVPIQTSSNTVHEREVREERLKNPPVLAEKRTKKTDPKKEDEGFGGGLGSDGIEDEETKEDEGFGGGFGSDSTEDAETKEDEGFGGGFGSDGTEDEETKEDEGFGGGFGSAGTVDEETKEDDGFGGGFGADQKTIKPKIEKKTKVEIAYLPVPKTGLSNIIDSMKLDWIDILLRHLVLVVGFLGAMLATRRRKHITVDALSKALSPATNAKLGVLTNLLSMIVCLFLADAGKNLVLLGLKFPKEIMWWANESTMQLVFPIGFGLLAAHFGVRIIENIAAVKTGDYSLIGSEETPSLSGQPSPSAESEKGEEE